MQYLLVLQWSVASDSDFDELIALENALEESLDESSDLDGHDIGPTEINIFIYTERPTESFLAAQGAAATWSRWPEVRAAYRSIGGETYTPVWPPNLRDFSIE